MYTLYSVTWVRKLGFVCALLIACSYAFSAHAAEVSFVAEGDAMVGGDSAIEIFLDTEQEMVNALEGSIVLPSSIRVKDIRFDGSVVSLWISRPRTDEWGVLAFAGLIPGGYQGTPDGTGRGNVFTLIVEPLQEGPISLAFGDDTQVLLSDGSGTAARLTRGTLTLQASPDTGQQRKAVVAEDIEPPLTFIPQIVDGSPYGIDRQVLVFDAQDKESGIAGYELAFSSQNTTAYDSLRWEKASSPYQLRDAELSLYIYVRAVDAAGNFRVAVLAPYHFSLVSFLTSSAWYVVAAFIVFFLIYRHRRSLKKPQD